MFTIVLFLMPYACELAEDEEEDTMNLIISCLFEELEDMPPVEHDYVQTLAGMARGSSRHQRYITQLIDLILDPVYGDRIGIDMTPDTFARLDRNFTKLGLKQTSTLSS